ncbi:outer membrane beta-barrel protein [Helicobacter sp. MIT 05-5293]|uniref:outer membrane beta-barrel protein n=1 Tax=Helicobacter sp. MIT 05-5293 TaxID=1548149 RepID=UPI00051D2EC6|nr:outer membrane beta-barrel protein [Helicobacter sp. MIT 05-5293]TLD82116.1 outer membrane beta-barrel protein [Helicobacter sp. MIT 05-5293]
MRSVKVICAVVLTLSSVWANDKTSAFFSIGAGFVPKIETNLKNENLSSALYTLHLKYGAKYYFNNSFGLSMYIPLEGGYSRFDEQDSINQASFFSGGVGGDVLLDIGSNRGLGVFLGGELQYSYYWLPNPSLAHSHKGLQSNVHLGLAVNIHSKFSVRAGVKKYLTRPIQDYQPLSTTNGYGVFVELLFRIDNSSITHQAQSLQEERRKKAEERAAQMAQNPTMDTGSRIFWGGGFGYGVGRSYHHYTPSYRPSPTPNLKSTPLHFR